MSIIESIKQIETELTNRQIIFQSEQDEEYYNIVLEHHCAQISKTTGDISLDGLNLIAPIQKMSVDDFIGSCSVEFRPSFGSYDD